MSWTLDFETFYDKDYSLKKCTMEEYIRSPQFQVIGVSVKEDDGDIRWISGTHEEIGAALKDLHLENETVIAHNAAFDCAILNWVFGIRPKFIIDTMSMLRPIIGIYPQGVSLRAAAEFFGIGHKGDEIYNTVGKRLEDFTPDELQKFGEYCRNDVALTWELWKIMRDTFPIKELYLIDLVIRMFTEPVLHINVEKLEKHYAEIVKRKQEIIDGVGHDNRDAFMSNDKFAELLREHGVEPPMKMSEKTGKMAYAFAKTDRGMQALLEHPDEFVRTLAAARLGLKSTIEETRTQAFVAVGKRGPLPIHLQYCGAVNTQRFSGGSKLNPQNLPRGGVLREALEAPEGYKIVACDSSNVEARTVAWLAGESGLLGEFVHGVDVYSSFASKVYGRPINKHDNPTERFVGKTCVLGLSYGTGAKKLREALHNGMVRVDLPEEECQRIVKLYRSTYPAIPRLWKQCQDALGYMYGGCEGAVGVGIRIPFSGKCEYTMPNGLTIKYPEMRATQGEYGPEFTYQKTRFRNKIYGASSVENLTQCLARVIVSYQMCAIKKKLDERSARLADGKIRRVVHMVHDEVVVVVPEEEAEETKTMMEAVMRKSPSWAQGLPLNCETGLGKNYGEAK